MDTSNLTKKEVKTILIDILTAYQPSRWWQRVLKRWLLKALHK